ncbi:MAG: substrate-binding domain-containing protein [Planctomycetes bacterium]|nr:substrate-binding domain-containing protein [Planctomycetota bacterium]
MADTLTEQCTERLRKELLSGSLTSRDGLITEQGLCKKLKVSRVTVRRCLALLRDEHLLRSIPYKGYVCGPAAVGGKAVGALARAKQDLILFVQAPTARPLFDNAHERHIWEGMQEEVGRLGFEAQHSRMPLKSLVKELKGALRPRLRGVALEWFDREVAETLLAEGIPAAMVEYMHEGLALDAVYQDNDGGTEQAVMHLWAQGHRRIGLVVWAEPAFHPLRRRAAFSASMLRRGVLESGRIGLSTRFDAEGGREATAALFSRKDRPTALILSHLEMAEGVFDELAARGMEPGKDVALAAWGTPEMRARALHGTRWAGLAFDLIAWSRQEMGRLIVRTLEARRLEPLLPALRVAVPTQLLGDGAD